MKTMYSFKRSRRLFDQIDIWVVSSEIRILWSWNYLYTVQSVGVSGLLGKIKSIFAAPDAPAAPPLISEPPFHSGIRFAPDEINPTIRPVAELVSADSERAFAKLNELKASRQRQEDVDFLRAVIFDSRQQSAATVEALKEELRYFPRNTKAREALAQLDAESPGAERNEPEFLEFLKSIRPYTMVGEERLWSLYSLARKLCEERVAGQVVECGVAAGGTSALLAATIRAHSKEPRKVFSFDTFEGMPPASDLDTHQGQHAEQTGWGTGTCAAPLESLLEIARKLQVENMIQPVKGLFAETLPVHGQTIGPIALLHVDGDWYSSTMDVLGNLYDQVVPRGYIQIDDYGYWEGCKKAVTEFQRDRGVTFDLQTIDSTGVWFQKT
jgi:hypothetical protein